MGKRAIEFVVDADATRDLVAEGMRRRRGSELLSVSPGESRIAPVGLPSSWQRRYEAVALCCDLLCVLLANLLVTLGYHSLEDISDGRTLAVVAAVPLAVMAALAVQHAWEFRILGSGTEEYRRVTRAYLFAVAALAVAGYAWGTSAGQSWTFGAMFLAWVLTMLFRKAVRFKVSRLRRQGECLRSVLVAGDAEEVHELVSRTRILLDSGWAVEGICISGDHARGVLPVAVDDVPVLGTDEDIIGIAQLHRFEAVALLPSGRWSHARTRRLSWDLEEIGIDLLIAPVLMDVVGPRLHIAPLSGLPLLHMSAPRYSGPAWVVKNVFDRFVAILILVLIAPALVFIALVIRFETPGPVLFRQTRVGRNGELFTMYKFRSMVADAADRIEEVSDLNVGAGVLFKIRDDPRVTRVGRFIRRYSCDELPQLFNVVRGDMSLVGPRPPLETEVARYGDDGARRRLFVKPGLTGLWQVSGRSDLSWEESLRADLRYVENWTFAMDLVILGRTVSAVLRSNGAY